MMNPIFKTKPAFQIIGINFRGNNDNNECPKLWESFSQRVGEIAPFAVTPIIAFGVCSDCDLEKNIFTYTAGLEVSDITNIPENMTVLKIPEHQYAVFECTLPTLMEALNNIHKKWLPKSDYILADTPEFELYDADFDPVKSDSKMYLYIPIIKK